MERKSVARPRITNSGYSEHGASRRKTSLLKWTAASKSPHEDISENVELLRERSRDLYSGGGPIGRGALDRVVLNAVGSGLRLNVRIDPELLGMTEEEASLWAARVEAGFDSWAGTKTCDFSGELSFYEQQVLALRSILLDGECLFILRQGEKAYDPYSLQVQLIEADRLCNPLGRNVKAILDEGVELDSYGRPCAYWIANRNPESEYLHQPALSYMRVPASKIYHLFMRERIGQHRGIPFLSPVIEQLKQLSRYTEAEQMAALVSGMYSIFFEHTPREDGAFGEEDYASESNYGEVPGLEGLSAEMMIGSIMDLPEGVKATSLSPGRPNSNFDQFITSMVKQIGSALGLPYEVMLQSFTASYSASRGALLEAWKVFKFWREWFAENFCQPVYEAWLMEAVKLGLVRVPAQFRGNEKFLAWASWTGPSQGQLDPVKEVNAAVMRIANNLSTYQRECGELTGEDFDLVNAALIRERAKIQSPSRNGG